MIKTRRLHAGAPHNSGGHITHTALILLAIGCVYWFLAEFPLRARESWAWWTFFVSGICGLASFLTYLAYGYLDTWHGIATLFLLPVFAEDYGGPARQRSRRVQERLGLLPSEPVPEANALGCNPLCASDPSGQLRCQQPVVVGLHNQFPHCYDPHINGNRAQPASFKGNPPGGHGRFGEGWPGSWPYQAKNSSRPRL